MRILLVEDSATQAARMSHLLEGQGWEVAVAMTGEGALEELHRRLPDLVVADYHLPRMKGDELCRQVRMNVNTRGVPLLMLTSDDTTESELRGLESGADDYIAKSVADDVLLMRIQALVRKSRAQSAILDGSDRHFREARILVIDDSPTFLEFVTTLLREEGFVVEQAKSGEQGLARVRDESFDCVIVDLVMPGLDGIAVCRELTMLRRAMDNPIVVLMLTAQESKDDMARGLDAGADDFVGKSSDTAVLRARIRALLRRKFFQEENQRILEEFNQRELAIVRARTEKEAAEARAALVEQLEQANAELAESNRKLQEAHVQLVRAEKMVSLGQLVAGIAHEINNPLSFVIANLYTIQRGVETVVGPREEDLSAGEQERLAKVRARLKDTRAGLERVKDLVQKLRTFSRLDAGVFGTLDVAESLDMALTFLQHKIRDHIRVEKRYGEVRELHCYPGELNQVFMNVLANAVEAMGEKGTLTVTTGERDGRLFVRVKDIGHGIAKEHLQRIFDPFFTTKPVGEGTGLGLAIAYSIVQAHQGHIDVQSEEGHGTTVTVSIPLDLETRVNHELAS